MIDLLRRHPLAFLLSLLTHAVVIGIGFVQFNKPENRVVMVQQGPQDQTIQAEVIDQKLLDDRAKTIEAMKRAEQKKRDDAARKRAAEVEKKRQAEQKKLEDARKKAEADKIRRAEQQKKAEAEKQRKAEEAAARKKAEAERKKAEAEQRRVEDERKRQEEEARLKAEAEQKRLQEEKRRAEEAERQRIEAERRKAEEERRKAEEARLAAEAEQRRKEAELKAQIAAEERQRAEMDELLKYQLAIKQKITRNWRQPVSSIEKPDCEVHVLQAPGGMIMDVTFGKCPGSTEYRLSIETAVYKSEPLPQPPAEFKHLFQREINILFKPN